MKNLAYLRGVKQCVLLCLSLVGCTTLAAAVDDDGKRPAKPLAQADARVHWPEGFQPGQADAFVHNSVFIDAPAEVIWSVLIAAGEWPKWYANSADVQVVGAPDGRLGPRTRFNWKTFGFAAASWTEEFVPNERLAWFGEAPGFKGYHTWLIVPKDNGCEVITEETQKGPSAISFNLAQSTAMFDAHHWWLAALKVRAEKATK